MLVALANMTAQDGNFDSRSRREGKSLLFFEESVLFPAWISLSSDLLMNWLSWGSFVTLYAHVNTQSNPKDENKMKGPEIPMEDKRIGVSNKPMTFPMWNPAIEIPTALALSWLGNHLYSNVKIMSNLIWIFPKTEKGGLIAISGRQHCSNENLTKFKTTSNADCYPSQKGSDRL